MSSFTAIFISRRAKAHGPASSARSPAPRRSPIGTRRILSECYIANARAHIMDGRVVHIRNNYAVAEFRLRPDADWLAGAPWRACLPRDSPGRPAERAERGGHGNAIAQSYNHSILPLLHPRDRAFQIAWGIEDFVCRFKRRPEGIWLPECAADRGHAPRGRGGRNQIYHPGAPSRARFTVRGRGRRGAGPFIWRARIVEPCGISLRPRPFARGCLSAMRLNDGARLARFDCRGGGAGRSRARS